MPASYGLGHMTGKQRFAGQRHPQGFPRLMQMGRVPDRLFVSTLASSRHTDQGCRGRLSSAGQENIRMLDIRLFARNPISVRDEAASR